MKDAETDYEFFRYNKFGVLKLGGAFWLISLFLSRHLFFLIVLGMSHGKLGKGPSNPALGALLDPIYFVSDFPALMMFFVAGARMPGASGLVRALWRNGRVILAASAVAYLILVVWHRGQAVAQFEPLTCIMIVLNVLILVWLFRSRYLKDLFAQFPEPDATGRG